MPIIDALKRQLTHELGIKTALTHNRKTEPDRYNDICLRVAQLQLNLAEAYLRNQGKSDAKPLVDAAAAIYQDLIANHALEDDAKAFYRGSLLQNEITLQKKARVQALQFGRCAQLNARLTAHNATTRDDQVKPHSRLIALAHLRKMVSSDAMIDAVQKAMDKPALGFTPLINVLTHPQHLLGPDGDNVRADAKLIRGISSQGNSDKKDGQSDEKHPVPAATSEKAQPTAIADNDEKHSITQNTAAHPLATAAVWDALTSNVQRQLDTTAEGTARRSESIERKRVKQQVLTQLLTAVKSKNPQELQKFFRDMLQQNTDIKRIMEGDWVQNRSFWKVGIINWSVDVTNTFKCVMDTLIAGGVDLVQEFRDILVPLTKDQSPNKQRIAQQQLWDEYQRYKEKLNLPHDILHPVVPPEAVVAPAPQPMPPS